MHTSPTVEELCGLGRELLSAEQAHQLDRSLANRSRLALARRRLDEAVRSGEAPHGHRTPDR
jgi:hypothetical protein